MSSNDIGRTNAINTYISNCILAVVPNANVVDQWRFQTWVFKVNDILTYIKIMKSKDTPMSYGMSLINGRNGTFTTYNITVRILCKHDSDEIEESTAYTAANNIATYIDGHDHEPTYGVVDTYDFYIRDLYQKETHMSGAILEFKVMAERPL